MADAAARVDAWRQGDDEALIAQQNRTQPERRARNGADYVPVLEIHEPAPLTNEPFDMGMSRAMGDSMAASMGGGGDKSEKSTKSAKKSKKEKKKDKEKGLVDELEEPVREDDHAYDSILGAGGAANDDDDSAAKALTAKEREKKRRRDKKKRARMELKMRISFVIETLQTRREETALTKELFVYIPFLIAFIFLFMIGASTEQAYWARAQLGGQLSGGQFPTLESYGWTLHPRQPEAYHVSTTLAEVRNPQDWHMWFQSIVLDFWWDLDDENEAAIANSWVQGSNMKFGAMRLRSLRMNNNSCVIEPEVTKFNYTGTDAGGVLRETSACWGKFDAKKVNRTTYGTTESPNLMRFIDCSPASRQTLFGFVDQYPCIGNAVEFPTMLSRKAAKEVAEKLRGQAGYNLGTISDHDLEDGFGYDDLLFHPFATRAVILEFFSYLPFIDQFQGFKVLTELTAGGRFVHFLQINTFQIWSLSRASDYVETIYFFLFYIFVFYYVAKLIAAVVSQFAAGQLLEFVLNFWNFWDLVNLLCFLAVAVCRLAWIRSSQRVHGSELLATTSYNDNLDFIALLFNLQLWLNAVNTVISFLKILKFIELNPTLNIVTRSLASAQQSLIGVMVIFVIVIVSFGITGVAVFSNGLEDFRDLNTSMSTLMRMLIGDFDYIALRDENRFAAPLFFWSFMILGLFLILNFLIGIILEAFEDESDTTRAEPIPLLISRFWKRISTSMRQFLEDPREYNRIRRERHAHRYHKEGTRLQVVIDVLKEYRLREVAEKYPLAELEALTDAEIEHLLEDEPMNRYDFPKIFDAVDPEQGHERIEWVSADYLDVLWELCVRNYHVHRLGDEDADQEELELALELAAEDALAYVVGIGRGRGNDATRKEGKQQADAIIGRDENEQDVPAAAGAAVDALARDENNRKENLDAVQQMFRPSEDMRNKVRTIEQSLQEAQEEAVEILRAVLREEPSIQPPAPALKGGAVDANVTRKLRDTVAAREERERIEEDRKAAAAEERAAGAFIAPSSGVFEAEADDEDFTADAAARRETGEPAEEL